MFWAGFAVGFVAAAFTIALGFVLLAIWKNGPN